MLTSIILMLLAALCPPDGSSGSSDLVLPADLGWTPPIVLPPTGEPPTTGPPFDLDLEFVIPDLSLAFPKPIGTKPVTVVIHQIDIDGDGAIDLHIETYPDRGPLSTYYSVSELVCLPHCRLLRVGAPIEDGDHLALADFTALADRATMCAVGGSLRFVDRPVSDFSGGPWYRADRKSLAMLIEREGRLGIGWITMSVGDLGEITIHEKRVEWLFEAAVQSDTGD